jgi:hypothetical protein
VLNESGPVLVEDSLIVTAPYLRLIGGAPGARRNAIRVIARVPTPISEARYTC